MQHDGALFFFSARLENLANATAIFLSDKNLFSDYRPAGNRRA